MYRRTYVDMFLFFFWWIIIVAVIAIVAMFLFPILDFSSLSLSSTGYSCHACLHAK